MKAYELSGNDIGKRLVITNQDGFALNDVLIGVTHGAELIDDRKMFDAVPHWVIGRRVVQLTFMMAGEVPLGASTEIQVIE